MRKVKAINDIERSIGNWRITFPLKEPHGSPPGAATRQIKEESQTRSLNQIYYPEDKLPLVKLIPMGIQHVIAMFGGTVLAPILMGFDPQITLFFSGIGTLLFIFITGLKVPSYLGSSFAFIGPILAITGGNASKIPNVLCGSTGAAVLYAVAAVVTIRWGPAWIDRLMPRW
jgi:xanthine/uracil permease